MTHLVEIRLDPAPLARWARNIGIGHADQDYVVHSVLCAAYGNDRLRPFTTKPGGGSIRILGYSPKDAKDLQDTRMETASPEVSTCFTSEVSKAMPETWKRGRRYGFEARVAPTRQRARGGGGGEVDALKMAPPGSDRNEVYLEWFSRRIGTAARLVASELESFKVSTVSRRAQVPEGSHRPVRDFSLPDALVSGILEVEDSEAFGNLISNGIGRHKAFGFGALMLRPA